MNLARITLVSLAMLAWPALAQSQPPPASTTLASSGVLGDCTLQITGGQYWRSAMMIGPRGASPDGFAPLIVSVSVQITCASDARLQIAAGSVLVGGEPRTLHRPERSTESMSAWDGRVRAGVALDLTITWRDGPYARRGSDAHAVVRFRRPGTAGILELAAPTGSVSFAS